MSSKLLIFVITGLAVGGAETQLVRVATRLKQRGWDVRVVTLMPPRAYADVLEQAGIPVTSLGIRDKRPALRPIWRLARIIRDWQPVIVHSHMVHANILTRFTRLLVPVPVLVCSARSIREGGRLREWLYRLTDPLCDLTTHVCEAGAQRYIRERIVPPHKMRVVYNGVDVEQFRPDGQRREQMRRDSQMDNHFVWLAVGRLEAPKDYPTLIRAFARISDVREGTLLWIVGDGPLRRQVDALTRDMGLQLRVRFWGLRADVPNLMNAADAFVMSSSWEGLPNVLLEAQACGLSAVVTGVGGNAEVVIHEKTGFIVPPQNPTALAEAMLRLMDMPGEVRQQMGMLARQRAEQLFSLESVVTQWENLYYELLQTNNRR
ncbi:MAG: glycosyltransferase [Firmicutes bacterium]|nr:glycosyltransferase [Bacillota bacterium]